MSAFDVATLGEMMMLLVADQPGPLEQVSSFHKRTAGAETNVAIGLARLGLRVTWASRLGDDSPGRFLRAEMARRARPTLQLSSVNESANKKATVAASNHSLIAMAPTTAMTINRFISGRSRRAAYQALTATKRTPNAIPSA